ncbi:MAG: DUF4126 domain-containing protein [Cyanobacteriota bacterium]|nr:DUF4126 domain-containing protein [Cyanobacteriota bacterium]
MDLNTWHLLESIGLGLVLGVAAGFRVVVPFFILSGAALWGHLTLTDAMAWLDSRAVFIGLAIALTVEVLAYSIPWLDNLVDVLALPLATISGTLLMALTTDQLDPFARWSLAIVAGGGAAATVKGLSGFTRMISTATTGGLTNLLVAIAELLGAVTLSLLALVAPFLALSGVLVLMLVLIGLGTKRIRGQKSELSRQEK